MVVAEIPLWLVHHASDSGGGANVILNPGSNDNNGDGSQNLERAHDALSLLDHTGRGKKCAIYGLDINLDGTKVATCGGDGTVRLWSVNALFSRKRSRYQDDGQYESSEASDDNRSVDGNVAETNANTNGVTAVAGPKDNQPETQQQNDEVDVVADGEKNDDEHDATNGNYGGDKAEQLQTNGDIREETNVLNAVHDLSNLVRRKKGGEIQPSPSKPTATTAATKPAVSSPSRPQHPNNPSQNSPPQQRLLCTLSAHTGSSVLAVRFSHNGHFLASAGDDAAVCIYAQDTSAGATGNLTESHSEHWSRIKLCRGHGLDVVGLAWAPDDSHLISCSLDSETPIIVWKLTDLAAQQRRVTHANVLCNPYKILGKDVHTSTVKGVTFDPAGTYLASSGDDPAICIWRAHDDWGLERRIDASSGIFRRWKEETEAQSLSSQTLFRRLSWSTDGAFVCSTNCVVKNKHVASTISRDGWNVSTSKSAAAGAANLVGHKQPVVVSRHCSQLLDARGRKKREDNSDVLGTDEPLEEDEEPEYATLLALGDRQGFVTVWSTRKSRPIFKLQCSETRCTVTDLAWGQADDNAMILLVSLLDGHVVALRFRVPEEVGPVLKFQDHARVFQLRYGIDLDDADDLDRRRLFVGDNSQPKFIENALQMSLENQKLPSPIDDEEPIEGEDGNKGSTNNDSDIMMMDDDNDQPEKAAQPNAATADVGLQQLVTTSRGKKRIRPVLMSVDEDEAARPKKAATITNGDKVNGDGQKADEANADPLKAAQHLAEKASTAMEAMPPSKQRPMTSHPDTIAATDSAMPTSPRAHHHHHHAPAPAPALAVGAGVTPALPYKTDKIHNVDLPNLRRGQEDTPANSGWVASCSLSFKVPTGSKGAALQCTDLSIGRDGKVSWRDQLSGSSCSALTASSTVLAVGTSDGSIMLYGTSPSLGWACGKAFRSYPPFVLGHAVVALHLHERKGDAPECEQRLDMLVVTADGAFGVYQIQPDLRLRFKGTIMPAMIHMMQGSSAGSNSSSSGTNDARLPKLSRIQITESDRLLMLLSSGNVSGRSESFGTRAARPNSAPASGSASGSIQAFVYNLPMELWMRISDGRFVLSDFYSSLPTTTKTSRARGVLSRLDDSVRTGTVDSLLIPVHHNRSSVIAAGQSGDIYQMTEEKSNYMATRAHCEDRMACAIALGSSSEFKHWLSFYVRVLSLGGHAELLRVLVDMLLGSTNDEAKEGGNNAQSLCWWLSSSPHVLNLDRKSLIQTLVIPEMSKNRALQRITNEIAMEMDAL